MCKLLRHSRLNTPCNPSSSSGRTVSLAKETACIATQPHRHRCDVTASGPEVLARPISHSPVNFQNPRFVTNPKRYYHGSWPTSTHCKPLVQPSSRMHVEHTTTTLRPQSPTMPCSRSTCINCGPEWCATCLGSRMQVV
jgi:hypothetical protein